MSILGFGKHTDAHGEDKPTRHQGMFNEKELFFRDLSEVHLLIDFVSGRSDKSLMSLKDITEFDARGKATTSMPPQRVVEEICKISYPPEGDRQATAQQAAFMLMVKDRLNYLASPARGLTVAFTSMFAGVALDLSFGPVSWLFTQLEPLWTWLMRRLGRTPRAARAAEAARAKGEFYSAIAAYPNLERQARQFRKFYDFLPVLAVGLVAFIVYVNWDVSVTGAVLENIADAQCSYESLTKGSCTLPEPGRHSTPPPRCYSVAACTDVITNDRKTLASLVDTRQFWRPVAFSFAIIGVGDASADVAATPTADTLTEPGQLETVTRDVIAGLNAIIIPTAFGWLGTLAGLMRSVTAKVRESILAPRDFAVAGIGMCLGMSAGLAVGLFVSDQTLQGSQPLGKTITITSAGLSFLAGFGAEAFFTFLDSLLMRLLPSSASTPPK